MRKVSGQAFQILRMKVFTIISSISTELLFRIREAFPSMEPAVGAVVLKFLQKIRISTP
jgi:hypothetical protein